MPKINVELDWETVDNIVRTQVTDARDGLIELREQRKKKNSKGGIFDTDRKKDLILMDAHIEAFDMVIKYFGGNIND